MNVFIVIAVLNSSKNHNVNVLHIQKLPVPAVMDIKWNKPTRALIMFTSVLLVVDGFATNLQSY